LDWLHYNVSICDRDAGGSAVASSAYISRSKIHCERDGLTKDYTRSSLHGERIVADLGVTLPTGAPAWMADRSQLWNSLEAVEKRGRLARKIVVALPDDIPEEDAIELARAIVAQHVAEGHVCDAAIHCNAGSKGPLNRHLHIQEPLRGVDSEGFEPKCRNYYLCRDGSGAEEWLSATELREANASGRPFEKVFKWRKGDDIAQMTQSEAAEQAGWKRAGKTPVQEGRYLHPEWDSVEDLERSREQAAALINEAQQKAGLEERVSHLSFEERGIRRIPTLHEGPSVRAMEERSALKGEEGPVTDVRLRNAEIRKANRLLRELAERVARLWAALRILRELKQSKEKKGSLRPSVTAQRKQAIRKTRSGGRGARKEIGGYRC